MKSEGDFYLEKLYKLAVKAAKNGDIPVSAIIIKNNKILSLGYNNRHKKGFVIGHAEVNAILRAEKKLNDFRLDNCILITTLKPCKMCAAIIEAARIKKVYYLLDQKSSESYPQVNFEQLLINESKMAQKYQQLFTSFFENMR